MYEGSQVYLHMKKNILANGMTDHTCYQCTIYKYDEENQNIYMILEDEELTRISLDAVYSCDIFAVEDTSCEGIVEERYNCSQGSMLRFRVKNGFYGRIS